MKQRNGFQVLSGLYGARGCKEIVFKVRDVEDAPEELRQSAREPIRTPEDIFKTFQFLFKGEIQERFVVFALDSANHVIAHRVISQGLLNSSLVHPREVFIFAITCASASIILAHNHPSNNPEPSQEDISITKQIVEAGKIMGIPVHDHIIFTDSAFTSFAERGLI